MVFTRQESRAESRTKLELNSKTYKTTSTKNPRTIEPKNLKVKGIISKRYHKINTCFNCLTFFAWDAKTRFRPGTTNVHIVPKCVPILVVELFACVKFLTSFKTDVY